MPATYIEIQKSQSKLKVECGIDEQIKQTLKKVLWNSDGGHMYAILILLYCYNCTILKMFLA